MQPRNSQDLRIVKLQNTLHQRNKQLDNEKNRFQRLKKDFLYNLRLLEDRDRELQKYDALISKSNSSNSSVSAEARQLRIDNDRLKKELAQQEYERERLQLLHHQRMEEQQVKINEHREEAGKQLQEERRHHRLRYEELQRQMMNSRKSMKPNNSQAFRYFNSEIKRDLDKMKHTAFDTWEDKNHCHVVEQNEEDIVRLKDLIQNKNCELDNTVRAKDNRIFELESEIKTLKSHIRRVQEDFLEKNSLMDQTLQEREQVIAELTKAKHGMEMKLNEKNLNLELSLDDAKFEKLRLQRECNSHTEQAQNDKVSFQKQIAGYQCKMAEAEKEYDDTVSILKQRIYSLTKNQKRLESERDMCRKDLESYQYSLGNTLKCFITLASLKEQAEIDWKLKLEEISTTCYNRQEEIFSALIKAKDETLAIAEKSHSKLQPTDSHLQAITRNQDGIYNNTPILQQNEILKLVIKEMRYEMEALTKRLAESANINNEEEYSIGSGSVKHPTWRNLTELLRDTVETLENRILAREIEVETANTKAILLPSTQQKIQHDADQRNLSIWQMRRDKTLQRYRFAEREKMLSHHISELQSQSIGIRHQEYKNKCSLMSSTDERDVNQSMYTHNNINEKIEKNLSLLQCENKKLKKRLGKALKYISQLVKEREKLLDVGNKLRYRAIQQDQEIVQLSDVSSRHGDNYWASDQIKDSKTEPKTEPKTKLQCLEELHYNIASEELRNENRKIKGKLINQQSNDNINLSSISHGIKEVLQATNSDFNQEEKARFEDFPMSYEPSDNDVISFLNSNISSVDGEDKILQSLWQMIDDNRDTNSSTFSP
ncbi:uncharacterized protein TRIADDRAFT_53062 [Trichoplax adhaerens]|uniref:Uncharacterized protein n=1 Tax=Trichoplax adhaerens TaxID=10228 RepID=B3RN72_TRIAD|nr:hypothetical protein TRIADDRAFT_53062 [Trichoplax adhaerens]EDV27403.1 hypothetical protein TRIADDRAFT_53062 [Trichoplax adhaerens]|eukprot:XP_002109237.1 hypothetical protein TRIADDRAFT_53062 [Trichoplax adhaerens]